jgi:hypothetical protein
MRTPTPPRSKPHGKLHRHFAVAAVVAWISERAPPSCGRITGYPEAKVRCGWVPIDVPAVSDQSLERCRLPITNPPKLLLTPFPANFRGAVRWPSEWPNFGVVSVIANYQKLPRPKRTSNISMIPRSSSGGYFAHCRPLPGTTAKLVDKPNPRSYATQRLATTSSSVPFLDTSWWSARNASVVDGGFRRFSFFLRD